MPIMVPRSTTQSARFTRRTGRTLRATPPRARTSRARTGRRPARCGSRAHPAHRRWVGRTAGASLAERDQIGEEPIRAGHAFRELAKPREGRVHEIAFPVPCHEQPALERLLAWIVGGEDRGEALVPLIRKVEPALLHPTVEIGRRD